MYYFGFHNFRKFSIHIANCSAAFVLVFCMLFTCSVYRNSKCSAAANKTVLSNSSSTLYNAAIDETMRDFPRAVLVCSRQQ